MDNKILFAQFAASAPDDIPAWFKHKMTDKPVEPRKFQYTFGTGSSHKHKDLYIFFYNDESGEWLDFNEMYNDFDYRTNENKVIFENLGLTPFVIPEELKNEVFALGIKWDQYHEDFEVWQYENYRQRYFQWRMFYAQQMKL